MSNLNPFITGSHAYGIPHNDSDIDMVALVSDKDLKRLIETSDQGVDQESDNYLEAGGLSLRFGKMNLICVLSPKLYRVWKRTTRKLQKQKPVSRAFAIRYMKKEREKAGFRDR